MGVRPEFYYALELIGQACARLAAKGQALPVLVGGAVVEWYTASAYMSGDFDLLIAVTEPMTDELLVLGFRHEDRPGWLRRGFYHPDFDFGVEFVSGQLFDGLADRTRIQTLRLSETSFIPMVPPEDIIADRMGQYLADPQHGGPLLAQAKRVFIILETSINHDYINRRLHDETAGEISLDAFKRLIGNDRG